MEKEYELIVTIVSKGQSDIVVQAAREAGATGGTIIYGKGTSDSNNSSFLGINLKAEKEIIFIVALSTKKAKIMEQITMNAGLSEEGKGLCFSLPINSIVGLQKN